MECSCEGCREFPHTVAVIKTTTGFGDNQEPDDILIGECEWHLKGETPPSMVFFNVASGLKGLAVAMTGAGKALNSCKNMLLDSFNEALMQMVLYGDMSKPAPKPEPLKSPLEKLLEPIKSPMDTTFELYSWQKNWYDVFDPPYSIANKPKLKPIKTSCSKCGGHGKRGNKRCRSCHGSGRGVPMNIEV